MIFISHRGNIHGPDYHNENKPEQINNALSLGYDVEVDVWLEGDKLFLGHDNPQYLTSLEFISNKKLWCHAKNVEALRLMLDNNIHCFWHQEDKYTLTSMGYVWVYPGEKMINRSICVMPEIHNPPKRELLKNSGICTDYPFKYKEIINEIK